MFNRDLKESVKKILQSIFPELKQSLAFPIKGKVLKVYTQNGKYKCDVLPLRNNLEEIKVNEKPLQVIKEVEINTITNGDNRGFFALPAEGSIVRVSFYNGDFNFPFVDAVLNSKTPALEKEEVAIYRSQNCLITLKSDNTIKIVTDGNVEIECNSAKLTSSITEITADTATIKAQRVNLGGSAGIEVARKGDTVKVGDQYGTITSGSAKVFAE